MPIFFAVFFVCFIALFVFILVRNIKAARKHDIDPFAAQMEVAGTLVNSRLLEAADKDTLTARLAELKDAHDRGLITDDEYADARRRALES
jgi:uncharacterized membrane protein